MPSALDFFNKSTPHLATKTENHYKVNSFRQLFCNSFGQDGIPPDRSRITYCIAEIPCEWKFATKFASDCKCDGLVHSEPYDLFFNKLKTPRKKQRSYFFLPPPKSFFPGGLEGREIPSELRKAILRELFVYCCVIRSYVGKDVPVFWNQGYLTCVSLDFCACVPQVVWLCMCILDDCLSIFLTT